MSYFAYLKAIRLLKLLLLYFSLFLYSTIWAGELPNKENEILAKIEAEFLKASINYNDKDSLLFNDFEEVLVSLAITDQFNEDEKLNYYEYLFLLIKDINTNLYAAKKIDEHDFRRAIRLMPSIFYYKKQGLLTDFLKQNQQDAIRALPYIYTEPEVKNFLLQYAIEKPKLFYGQI